jgi:signal transduction histidine kinase/ABC-type multidrug transport system ATPase subunit
VIDTAVLRDREDPVLRARDVSVHFGPIRALDHVDVDIPRGEIVVLAGENGAGKSTLVRCIAGDMAPDSGVLTLNGHRLSADPRAAARLGVAVVWQDLALCDNLDIASNLLLGAETRRLMFSETRFHARATELLSGLGIDFPDTTTAVAHLSGGQRQLVAVARAMRDRPQLLILDEPTASLGVYESGRVEELVASLPAQGTTVLIVSHDVDQMFRLANRIVILRRGRSVAEVDPHHSHPDEVAAILSGQPVDVSARRQLNRLHNLADQLASAEPSSSLSLILSALSAALGSDQLCIHVSEGGTLRMVGAIGLSARLRAAWKEVPSGLAGGQVGRADATGLPVATGDVRSAASWARYRNFISLEGFKSSWSVPFTGASGDSGVITVMSGATGDPTRDDIDLATLYAGYAASALERDRLLNQLTTRNRVLETIRDVLETLAGPVPLETGLDVALRALLDGLGAREVGLMTKGIGQHAETVRGWAAARPATGPSDDLLQVARQVLDKGPEVIETAGPLPCISGSGWRAAVGFPAPDGVATLAVTWEHSESIPDHEALIDDAANSLRLALEREESERAQRETMALRSSQELQRQFLSWLSHELRTPLTAIRGYASSLMQPDVSWDGGSQQRFLERIGSESARLGRLVDDLLDFSAIDAGILRLHQDWCDVGLVLEAARSCLPADAIGNVRLIWEPDLPVVWADHDRLEQIFVNLFDNAVRHNPVGTSVTAEARSEPEGYVTITVVDDGIGVPTEILEGSLAGKLERRRPTGGAGLGLSISKGIVDAHGGRFEMERLGEGTRFNVVLPVALGAPPSDFAGERATDEMRSY